MDFFAARKNVEVMVDEHVALWSALFGSCGPYLRHGLRVMDFGCSDGHMLELFLRGDGIHWMGADCAFALGIDRPAVTHLLEQAGARLSGLPAAFSSAPPSAFPAQFDLILSHEVIYLLPDLSETFAELHDALAPGGHLVLATGCHIDNQLYASWRQELAREGVAAMPYSAVDYTDALRSAGFSLVEQGALRLSVNAYDEWVKAREDEDPNPAWFPSADTERSYYTELGKLLLVACRA